MHLIFIDGLRGFFALFVIFSHYSVLFYHIIPSGFRHSSATVCGFFIVTGFVMTCNFWKNRDRTRLTYAALRRYIRLTAVPLASIICSYLLLKHNLFIRDEIAPYTDSPQIVQSFLRFTPHFWDAVKEGLWGMYFAYDQVNSYNAVLWTMKYELKGSILLLAFLALFGNIRRREWIYLCFIIIFIDTIYPTFIFGAILSDMMYSAEGEKYREFLANKSFLPWIALIVGVFFYFYALDFNFVLYEKLNFSIFAKMNIRVEPFYHVLGSVLVVFAIFRLECLQRIFSHRFFTTVGKYSFSLYAMHSILLLSFGSLAYLKIMDHFSNHVLCVFLGTVVSLAVTIAITIPLHHLIDVPAGKLSRRVQKFFE